MRVCFSAERARLILSWLVGRYAWPPHQIMAWVGFERYGRLEDAQRLAYRWLYMMTTAFVDFNGVVPEKVSLAATCSPWGECLTRVCSLTP